MPFEFISDDVQGNDGFAGMFRGVFEGCLIEVTFDYLNMFTKGDYFAASDGQPANMEFAGSYGQYDGDASINVDNGFVTFCATSRTKVGGSGSATITVPVIVAREALRDCGRFVKRGESGESSSYP
jgi:hypothetical protein